MILFGKELKTLTHKEKTEIYERMIMMAEPCESTKFSLYINEKGQCVPCSFMENMNWNEISDIKYFDMLDDSIKNSDDFIKKVWNSPEYLNFGKCSSCAIGKGQGCHIYNI